MPICNKKVRNPDHPNLKILSRASGVEGKYRVYLIQLVRLKSKKICKIKKISKLKLSLFFDELTIT
jgi:hypothetical protein